MISLFHDTGHACSKLVTERYSTSFSSAIRVLHKDLREPIYDIYGFVRFADEIVDSFHGHDKAALLAAFKSETEQAIEKKISLNPILNSFQLSVNKYGIGKDLIDAFFRSMEQDLTVKGHDRRSYEEYIYGSAEAVGLMCLAVFCEGDDRLCKELRPGAQALGAAFQKINFLRDLKADHDQLKRVYFPAIDFNRFTVASKQEIEMEIVADLESASAAIPKLPSKARFGVYLAYKYYRSLFNKIRKANPDRLLQSRVRISNPYKIWILLRAGFRSSMNIL